MEIRAQDYKVVPVACPHNCGGKCLLKAHIRNGVIERISTDEERGEAAVPPLRGCARGRAYRQRIYAPDRLQYPMLRDGRRGEGKFRRISWDEALDRVAEGMARIKMDYGCASIMNMSSSGSVFACLHNPSWVFRLLNMFGGQTQLVGNISNEAGNFAARYTYGTTQITNEMNGLENSKLIILWGWDPAVSIHSTSTTWHIMRSREKGIRIIAIDPRYTDSAAALSEQWVPIRPGTDAAMLAAMAYVILEEGLEDRVFLDRFVYGFQEYSDYVTGAADGAPKTPQWAELLTGVAAGTITEIAREYATSKPAALMSGMGPGRSPHGEQFFRAAAALSAMTGNVGILGGSAAIPGGAFNTARFFKGPKVPSNPTGISININGWAEAMLKGKEGGYPSDIKMVYCVAGNLLNQLGNINKGVEALSKLDFMVVHEQFMTPTARFADVLLPATTSFEREDVFHPWAGIGNYALYSQKVIEPMHECKNDLEILTLLAQRLGLEDFNDKTEPEWLDHILAGSGIEDVEEFKRSGLYRFKMSRPHVALQENIEHLEKTPLKTPTGKIELYSSRLAEQNNEELPPIPSYIPGWESDQSAEAGNYPLVLLTPQSKKRCHSIYDNIPLLQEIEPHTMWINPRDAAQRGIHDGDRTRVRSKVGKTHVTARVTERIMPGVVSIDEGRWYNPGQDGVDMAGSANALVQDGPSPGGAARLNNNRVEVEKVLA